MRLKKKKLLGIILSLVLVLGLMPGMTITANATGTTYKILEVDGGSSRVIAESVTLPYATTVNAFRNSWDQENQHIKSVPTCNSGTESVVTVGAQSGTLGQSGCDFALTINNAGSEELSFEVLWDDSTYTEDIGLAVIANTDHEGTTNGCGWKYTYATKTLDILSGTPARLFETDDDYLLKNLEITTINIADSVTGIGDEAFDSSNGLASVNISADSSITSIGQWAFSNCSGLTSITIPAGVTSIADNAFNNCPNIADVYCYAAPSTLSWTTSNTYTNFKENKATVCHVKQSDLEEWKAKANLNLTFVGDLKSNPVAIAPTATATYGQTLADVTLTNPTGNTEGTWAWVDATTTSVGTVGEHTFKANFTPTDSTNYNSVSNVDVTVTVAKANSVVTAAPTAKNLKYNGSAQELVTAGTVEGGEMQYALGTKDAATEEYTTSIPTATDAGTYYVWYKVVGDSKHLDSDAGYVTVTIATAESSDSGSGDSSGDSSDNTNTDTDTSAKVPYEEVAISTGSVKDITGTAAATAESNPFGTKIENNDNLTTLLSLTDAEVAQGVNVWLDIQDMSSSVPQTDKTLIQNTSGDYTVGLYLDINLFKKVGSNDATKVTETNGKVKASIVIPESLWKSGRTFEIIRVHDGVATAIAGTYDENTHVFTFETDKFSTYALAYKDPASSSNSGTTSNSSSSNGSNSIQATAPKTGDSNDIRVWYLLLMASLGGLGFIGYSKKKEK